MSEILEDLLKEPEAATLIVGILFGVTIFYFPYHRDFFVIAVLTFISTDIIGKYFVRGGRGIFQITLLGTETRYKGHAYIAYFIHILGVTVLLNISSDQLIEFITPLFNEMILSMAIGLALAFLVYLDMNEKFYVR